jgi:TolB-like protein/tetratricopeptide (TPR) repeat protein
MSLFADLQRRNVIRVAIGYVAVSWLVLQAGSLIFGAFDLPTAWTRGLLAVLAIGFFPALIIAWVYEITPDGIRRASDVVPGESVARLSGRKLDFAVIGVLATAVVLLLVDRFVVAPRHASGAYAASIAVLPFVDMSQAQDQGYFSDGLSEELLDLLARVPQLKVIARTSSFAFKGKDVDVATIAKTLNVATVLEGSVRKSGNTLRVTAQLIHAADSTHLWSNTYEREVTDVFTVQDAIAASVVDALKLKLLPIAAENTRRTSNIEVYNQFLIGKDYFKRTNVDDWRNAETAFRAALKLDADYAPAWAGLAMTLGYLGDFAADPDAIAAMKRDAFAAADKAIALAPNLADGYEARSFLRYSLSWDWDGAYADLDRIAALDPNSATLHRRRASLLAVFGRVPEATAEIRKSLELDPVSAGSWDTLGMYQAVSGDIAGARASVARAVEINPKSLFTSAYAGVIELIDGKPDAARTLFARGGDSVWGLLGTVLVEHTAGNDEASRKALDKLIEGSANGSAYQIAEGYAWRGETDQAFEWLDRAFAQHDGGMPLVATDPLVANVRADPRFAEVRRKMKLPP